MDLKASMQAAGFAPDQCFIDIAEMVDRDPGFRNTKITTTTRNGQAAPGMGWGVQVGIK